MSKVMIDANVWVDIVLGRPDFVAEPKGAVMACIEEGDAYPACKDRAFRDEIGMNCASTYKSRPLRQDVIEKQPDR